jgi:diaminopimelate epimerase
MIPFLKMHGLGNDFAVFDARKQALVLNDALARAISDRHRGIGCDQVIVIEPSDDADAFMRIRNADGAEVETCGNAARCVARLLLAETERPTVRIETLAGTLDCRAAGRGLYAVEMGKPEFQWDKIPLARPVETGNFALNIEGKTFPATALSMGNPHCVLFGEDAEAADVAGLGPRIETDPLFPARTNVEFASVRDRGHIRMRVWERGAGITLACGSGACATAVAAIRRGLTDEAVEIALDGGVLQLEWHGGSVLMTGPAAFAYCGEIDLKALA